MNANILKQHAAASSLVTKKSKDAVALHKQVIKQMAKYLCGREEGNNAVYTK